MLFTLQVVQELKRQQGLCSFGLGTLLLRESFSSLVLCDGVEGQGFVSLFNKYLQLFPWLVSALPSSVEGQMQDRCHHLSPLGWEPKKGRLAQRNLWCCRVKGTRGRTMFPLVKCCCSCSLWGPPLLEHFMAGLQRSPGSGVT